MTKRRKFLLPLIIIWILSLAALQWMLRIEPALIANPQLFAYGTWIENFHSSILYKIYWILGDWTECQGYKSLPGAIGLIVSGFLAHFAMKKNPALKMYPVCGPIGLFPQMILAGCTGVAVAVFVYAGGSWNGAVWFPTFMACASIPAAVVLTYGAHWTVWLSAGIIGGLIQCPLSIFANNLAGVFGVPPIVVFTIVAVGFGGMLVGEVFRLLPWNKELLCNPEVRIFKPYHETSTPKPEATASWYLHRLLADFTDLLFFGNEWTSIVMIAGLVLSWFLNPLHVCYGVPTLFPAMLAGQFLGTSLAIFIWYERYEKQGSFNTFCVNEVMAVTPLFFGLAGTPAVTSPLFLAAMAALSAVICPWICEKLTGFFIRFSSKRYDGVVAGVIASAPALGISIAVITFSFKGLLALSIF